MLTDCYIGRHILANCQHKLSVQYYLLYTLPCFIEIVVNAFAIFLTLCTKTFLCHETKLTDAIHDSMDVWCDKDI